MPGMIATTDSLQDSRSCIPEDDLIRAITTNTRKAPVFLRGLLQFDLRLVEPAGIEPATSYLQIRLALFQTLPDSPFPEFIP